MLVDILSRNAWLFSIPAVFQCHRYEKGSGVGRLLAPTRDPHRNVPRVMPTRRSLDAVHHWRRLHGLFVPLATLMLTEARLMEWPRAATDRAVGIYSFTWLASAPAHQAASTGSGSSVLSANACSKCGRQYMAANFSWLSFWSLGATTLPQPSIAQYTGLPASEA